MTIDEAISLMKNEVLCVEHGNICDRNCTKCELVQKDSELLTAYSVAITALERANSIGMFAKALRDCEMTKDDKGNMLVSPAMWDGIISKIENYGGGVDGREAEYA